jgi:hypothetical protein
MKLRQTEYFVSKLYGQGNAQGAVAELKNLRQLFLESCESLQEITDERIEFVVLPTAQSGVPSQLFAILTFVYFTE